MTTPSRPNTSASSRADAGEASPERQSRVNKLLEELTWRGLLHQSTSESLGEHLAAGPRRGYVGFDPTANSLTIGNLKYTSDVSHVNASPELLVPVACVWDAAVRGLHR